MLLSKTTGRAAVRIDTSLKIKLDIYASAQNIPTAQLMNAIVTEWLEKQPQILLVPRKSKSVTTAEVCS